MKVGDLNAHIRRFNCSRLPRARDFIEGNSATIFNDLSSSNVRSVDVDIVSTVVRSDESKLTLPVDDDTRLLSWWGRRCLNAHIRRFNCSRLPRARHFVEGNSATIFNDLSSSNIRSVDVDIVSIIVRSDESKLTLPVDDDTRFLLSWWQRRCLNTHIRRFNCSRLPRARLFRRRKLCNHFQ